MKAGALTWPGRGLLSRIGGRAPGPAVRHIALGTFCHTAEALRTAGLRRWSGPFDWVFSRPGMVADCLDDGFAAFLDPRYLRSVPPDALPPGSTRGCRHILYEERYGLPAIFNHHDPATRADDRLTLERAVARFREALGGGRNLFYMLGEAPWPDADLERLREALARQPGGSTLIVLTSEAGTGEPGIEEGRQAAPDLLSITIRTRTRSRGLRFADPGDDRLLADTLKQLAVRLAEPRQAA